MFIEQPETFMSLMHDRAHWEFELFVTFVENVVSGGLIGCVIWPKIKSHWTHHIDRDRREGIK